MVRGFPEACSEAGQISGAEGGCLGDLGADDGNAEDVGLELHEEVVDGCAAIYAEGGKGGCLGLDGLEYVCDLEGDAFKSGASDVAGEGSAAEAD